MGKAARDRSARERLAEEREHQAKRQKQARTLMISLGALAVIAVAVFAVVLTRSGDDETSAYHGPFVPATRQADGSIVMAKPGVNKPVLEIFEDFQCPSCKAFEKLNGPTVQELAAAGKVRVVYRPFQLFRQEPLKSNSLRAANAALCAPADKWIQYHDLIYKHQPAEGDTGFSDADLISWARKIGIRDPAFEKCVNGHEKLAQVTAMTQYAVQTAKVASTPTVKLDGRVLGTNETFTVNGLRKAILAAAAREQSTPAPAGS
ncbi:MAG: oxidoreductase [Streptosporangiaceae bacterium]|jgi:protein-disulfide isomerase|nr:oxidoreductase [Streptosporangiaceae bacterium]